MSSNATTTSKLAAWLRQPTTVLGLAATAAAIAKAAGDAITHTGSWITVAMLGVGGLVAIVLPDNTAAKSSVEKLVEDTARAAAERRIAAMVPVLAADALAAVQALTTAPTTTTTVTVTPGHPVAGTA